jgi:hypothetical protein
MPKFVWKPAHTAVAAVAALVLAGSGVGIAATRSASAGPPAGTLSAASPPHASPGLSSHAPASPSPTSGPGEAGKTTDPLTGGRPSSNGVLAVKVENIAAARPQVGLSSADIVVAEEVEGAQTRLVAVYHSRFPRRLGPVRSARSTDAQLLPLFGRPVLVYSGANRRVQAKIDRASITPVQRTTRDHRRVAPHNVFVNLRSLAAAHPTRPAEPIGWVFQADADVWRDADRAVRPRSSVGHDDFRFDYARGRYTVRWNGARYADGDSGAVSRAENVVVLSVHNHPDGNRDVLGAASVMSDTVGRGRVTVYRDGRRISGTWERATATDVLRLRDGDGRDIPLRPGQTWITLQG